MTSWLESRDEYERIAEGIDPAIRLRGKQSSRLMRTYSRIPGMGREFLEETATAVGPFVFLPENWGDVEKEIFHEGRHVRQMRRYFGFGLSPWIGFLPFAVASVLLLPAGLTVRFWLELDAEAFALRRKFETGSKASWVVAELVEFAGRLAGPGYVWAWPKRWAERIARRKATKLIGRKDA